MGWMQFASAIIGHLMSWPVFGIVAVVIMRHQLASLIHRITSYEGLGQKLTFGQELAKVEEQIEALAPPKSHVPQQPQSTEQDERYILMAQQAPAAVVLAAWRDVEVGLMKLWERYAASDHDKTRSVKKNLPGHPNPFEIARWLDENHIIPTPLKRVIDSQRQLRNRSAHGGPDPTVGEAIAYAETAREVGEILSKLASLPSGDAEAIVSEDRENLQNYVARLFDMKPKK
jgi:hypothetical protein